MKPPFDELRGRRRTKGLKLFELENPIPAELTDVSDIQKMFDEFKLVPFATRDKKNRTRAVVLVFDACAIIADDGGRVLTK